MSTKSPESSSTAQQGETPALPPPQPSPQESQVPRPGNAIKSGPLFISSKGIGWTSWKKRWFILTTNSLIFYRSDPAVAPQKPGEMNLILGGIDLNNSGSVEIKPDKKLLTVLFSDARDGRAFTLKAETSEDLHDWKNALESALAQAPSATAASGQNGLLSGEQAEATITSPEQQKDGLPVKSMVLGRPILLALEDADGTPSFLEKALQFIETHGVRTEGILRQAADAEHVERRIQEFEQGKTEFSPEEDAHIIGDCMKYILRELPSSPVPASCCTALLNAYRTDRSNRINAMRTAILETFPEPNRKLLQRMLEMMQVVISQKAVNRMSTSAVAACMAPLLLRPLLAGECEVENQGFEMAGDNSLQLMQAAAAANHAQAIIIMLLDDYNKIFGNAMQESSLTSELFSEDEGEESGSGEETEYEDDEEAYDDEDEDNEYESDEEYEEDEEREYGSDDEGETGDEEEDDDEYSGSEVESGSDYSEDDDSVDKAGKDLKTESFDFASDDEKETERLDAEKKELEKQIAEEVQGKESLLSLLRRQRKTLHARCLALERDVIRMEAELQNEKDLTTALDAGLGISQNPVSSDVNDKTELKEGDDGTDNQKPTEDDGVQHNQQPDEDHSAASDRSVPPSEAPSQETISTNKPKVNEDEINPQTGDNSTKSKGQQNMKSDGADSGDAKKNESSSSNKNHGVGRSSSARAPANTSGDAGLPRHMNPSGSRRFMPKGEASNNFTLSKLTTRLNFLKEKPNAQGEASQSPGNTEKGKGPEGSSSNKQESNVSQTQQNPDHKPPTEGASPSRREGHKKSTSKSASMAHHNSDKMKPGESRSMRKRSSRISRG